MARGTTPAGGTLWKRWGRWVIAAALLAAASLPAHAQQVERRLVEAAYVLNFLRFSAWPGEEAEPDRPWRVVVIGPRQAAEALRELVDEAKDAGTLPRPLRVVHLAGTGDSGVSSARLLRSLREAHAVFVAEPDHPLTPLVVAEASERPLLSIGVGAGFARAGGMLALVEEGGRLGFTCNEAAVMRSPVTVSAKVLRIARPLEPRSALDPRVRWLLAATPAPRPPRA